MLSSEPAQETGEKSHMFFQFKLCKLYCRSQVVSTEELQTEKEAKKFKKSQEKKFKAAVLAQGGIKPSIDYSIPVWAKRSAGLEIDVAVDEISAAGFMVEDANSLFSMLQMA